MVKTAVAKPAKKAAKKVTKKAAPKKAAKTAAPRGAKGKAKAARQPGPTGRVRSPNYVPSGLELKDSKAAGRAGSSVTPPGFKWAHFIADDTNALRLEALATLVRKQDASLLRLLDKQVKESGGVVAKAPKAKAPAAGAVKQAKAPAVAKRKTARPSSPVAKAA